MKTGKIVLFTAFSAGILAGCTDEAAETSASTEEVSAVDSIEKEEVEEVSAADSQEDSVETPVPEEETGDLSEYSAEEIEYAHVWLQLGPNQNIDQLYVKHVAAGTLVNPLDETSAVYPEEVIRLSGGRMVDGSVTYSGNGDSTINVYNVPYRWESNPDPEAGEDFMKEHTEELIENTKLVYIEPAEARRWNG